MILRLRTESVRVPYSKEERKARNRLTAKKSRDKKNAYIHQLETSLRLANERAMELERRIESMELQLLMAQPQHDEGGLNGVFCEDADDSLYL